MVVSLLENLHFPSCGVRVPGSAISADWFLRLRADPQAARHSAFVRLFP